MDWAENFPNRSTLIRYAYHCWSSEVILIHSIKPEPSLQTVWSVCDAGWNPCITRLWHRFIQNLWKKLPAKSYNHVIWSDNFAIDYYFVSHRWTSSKLFSEIRIKNITDHAFALFIREVKLGFEFHRKQDKMKYETLLSVFPCLDYYACRLSRTDKQQEIDYTICSLLLLTKWWYLSLS